MKKTLLSVLILMSSVSALAASPSNAPLNSNPVVSEGIEGADLKGVLLSSPDQAGKVTYYFQTPTMGSVELEPRHKNAPGFIEQLKKTVGKEMTVKGSWNEFRDDKLVFTVDAILVMP